VDRLARERQDAERRQAELDKAAQVEQQRKDREAEKEAKRQAKSARKAGTGLTVEPAANTDKPADNRPPCNQGQNILETLARQAKVAPSKDVAGVLVHTIRHAEDQLGVLADTVEGLATEVDADQKGDYGVDDILEAVPMALEDHKGLSAKGKRAIKAAHLVLTKRSGPSPAEVANALAPEQPANGQLTAAK